MTRIFTFRFRASKAYSSNVWTVRGNLFHDVRKSMLLLQFSISSRLLLIDGFLGLNIINLKFSF